MYIFNLNYNHTDRQPEDLAIFIDNIGAPDIDFGSVCYIYQLLNSLKTKIDSFGSKCGVSKRK